MHRMTRRIGAFAAAPLLALALASCGDEDLTSADAQKDCVDGATSSEAAKALTEEQKANYCKCILPKLEDAGVKSSDDLEKAVADNKDVADAVRVCATKYFARGY
jgi:hypothetical protein